MMKCKEIGFTSCICSNCVYNENYAVNTPKPCFMVDCDLCAFGASCEEIFTYHCTGHMTIEDVNKMLEKGIDKA